MLFHLHRSRGLSIAAALGLWLAPTACQNQGGFIAPKDDKGKKEEKKNEATSDNDERVDIPNNIVGSYLICALRKDATASDLSSDYGCRLNDASTNQKLDISSVLASIQWGGNISENISINPRSPIEAWHAIYTVKGPTVESIQETANRLSIRVQWTGNGKAPQMITDQPLIEVLRPITSTGDTSAPIIQKGIDPEDPGIPTGI